MVEQEIRKADPIEKNTLENFSHAPRFNRWLFENIVPYCKGKIFEAGSGLGNLTQLFLENEFATIASDVNPEYCERLQQNFGCSPFLNNILQVDLAEQNFRFQYPELLERFDTVVATNVIEHIANVKLAISNCRMMLRNGGHLVIVVPAYEWLYNSFDKHLGHCTRYSHRKLTAILRQQQLEVISHRYFNLAGISGWLFSGTLMKKRQIPRRQLQLFDRMVPLAKFVDHITMHKIGLSLIEVARKF